MIGASIAFWASSFIAEKHGASVRGIGTISLLAFICSAIAIADFVRSYL